jgi:hypothetical protein
VLQGLAMDDLIEESESKSCGESKSDIGALQGLAMDDKIDESESNSCSESKSDIEVLQGMAMDDLIDESESKSCSESKSDIEGLGLVSTSSLTWKCSPTRMNARDMLLSKNLPA